MRSIFFLLAISIVMFSGLACEKECDCAGTGEFEYMIFGHFYGECGGEGCVEIYKFDREHLYEDSTDVYPNSQTAYAGAYYLLPDTKFQQVKDLVDDFPAALYEEPDNVLGMPDAGDWGGVYVEIKMKDEQALSGFWLLDQHEGNMPQVYNDFVDRINEKIAIINQ
jgi:hypothetical protein